MGIVNHKQKRIAYNHNERDELDISKKTNRKAVKACIARKAATTSFFLATYKEREHKFLVELVLFFLVY